MSSIAGAGIVSPGSERQHPLHHKLSRIYRVGPYFRERSGADASNDTIGVTESEPNR